MANDLLVRYLESIDKRLLDYLDSDEDLEEESGFGPQTGADGGGPPSGLVRGYLLALELELDVCPEIERGP
jgi:hypothetical protein